MKLCSNYSCRAELPPKWPQRYCRQCKAAYAREWRKLQPTRREVIEALQPYGLTLADGSTADIVSCETSPLTNQCRSGSAP